MVGNGGGGKWGAKNLGKEREEKTGNYKISAMNQAPTQRATGKSISCEEVGKESSWEFRPINAALKRETADTTKRDP